jgi:hypothetical protein
MDIRVTEVPPKTDGSPEALAGLAEQRLAMLTTRTQRRRAENARTGVLTLLTQTRSDWEQWSCANPGLLAGSPWMDLRDWDDPNPDARAVKFCRAVLDSQDGRWEALWPPLNETRLHPSKRLSYGMGGGARVDPREVGRLHYESRVIISLTASPWLLSERSACAVGRDVLEWFVGVDTTAQGLRSRELKRKHRHEPGVAPQSSR